MNIQISEHFDYKKLMCFCAPTIAMMICTSIYGLVDGLFVSNFVGKTAFSAVNLVWPFLMIMGCFGFMIGTGGSALVAKTLGEGDKDKANRYFTMLIYLSLGLGTVLSVLGCIFMPSIAKFLGADESMRSDCIVYGRIMVAFNMIFMLQYLFQSFLTTAAKPNLGFIVTIAAGITNVILDAVFIAVFKWGVAGAAAASVIGQVVGGVLPLFYFARPNSSLLRIKHTKPELKPLLKACGNGSSELMSNISSSFVSMLYNFQLMKYAGEDGIAAYGVLMYTWMIFGSVFVGYAIGTAPIISFHYGAENYDELKGMLKKSVVLMFGGGILMLCAAWTLSAPLSHIFVGYDRELFELTKHAFRIFAFSFVMSGFNIFASSFFTALNNGAISAAISFLRTLVFQMTAVLVLPLIFGIDGIWWAMIAAELFALVISTIFIVSKRNRYHYF